jgi:hypothetical protein
MAGITGLILCFPPLLLRAAVVAQEIQSHQTQLLQQRQVVLVVEEEVVLQRQQVRQATHQAHLHHKETMVGMVWRVAVSFLLVAAVALGPWAGMQPHPQVDQVLEGSVEQAQHHPYQGLL